MSGHAAAVTALMPRTILSFGLAAAKSPAVPHSLEANAALCGSAFQKIPATNRVFMRLGKNSN
jgi:hypothetical protein